MEKWRSVLEKHIKLQRSDKGRIIYKSGIITVTLYDKPKNDPRSKLHIQSRDQKINLVFIMDNLSLFYREVCYSQQTPSALELKNMQRAMCPKCGKLFTNKKGVKHHILRMHIRKSKRSESLDGVTLDENPDIMPN